MSVQNTSSVADPVPLLMIKAEDGEEVSGITRFQKLVFLAQMGGLEDDPIPSLETDSKYEFEPYDYGPYSKELYDNLDSLVEKGLVKTQKRETPSGNTRKDYSLTEEGRDLLDRASKLGDISEIDKKIIRGIKRKYNDMPLFELIDKVYAGYPEYAKNSKLS